MSNIAGEIYDGLAEVGYPLALVSSVVTTFICGVVIYTAIRIKRGTVNPPPTVPGKTPLTPDELGNGMIVVAVLVAMVSWMWAYLSHKYKALSAFSATGSIITMLSSLAHMTHTC